MESNKELMKKIKKLMALANSSNQHEAELAASKAQALMTKHNLTEQTLGNDHDYFNEEIGEYASKLTDESSAITNLLNRYFFVRTYYSKSFWKYSRTGKRQYKSVVRICGTESNVEVAKYVHAYLMHTFKELWKTYSKDNKGACRKSFMWGLFHGLDEKLKAAQKNVETEMGLVVVPDRKLDAWMKGSLNLSKGRGMTAGRDNASHEAGKAHGRNINIARGLTSDSSSSGKLLQ